MNMNSPIAPPASPLDALAGGNDPARRLDRGRRYWILVISIGVFVVALLGGLLLLPRQLLLPPPTPIEVECMVYLPRSPSRVIWTPTLEASGSDENISSETFRSWLLQKGVLIPPKISIQVDPQAQKGLATAPHSSLQKDAGFFPVQLVCRSENPLEARGELEALGQQIVQLWQSEWDSAEAAEQKTLLDTLEQLRSAWTAQELQEELFYESLVHWGEQVERHSFGGEEHPPSWDSSLEKSLRQPILTQESSRGRNLETPPPAPQQVENPQWTALSQQLRHWQSRRQKLLEDRTLEHPAVQQAELEIAHTQELLAQIPRWLSVAGATVPDSGPQQTAGSPVGALAEESGTALATQQSEPHDAPIPKGRLDWPVRLDQPKGLSGQAPATPNVAYVPRPGLSPWEEGLLVWEIFLAQHRQARQSWYHLLAQAHQMANQRANSSKGRMIRLQSTVRPLQGWNNTALAAWPGNWFWRLGVVSLLAALTAAELSRVALGRLRIGAPKHFEAFSTLPTCHPDHPKPLPQASEYLSPSPQNMDCSSVLGPGTATNSALPSLPPSALSLQTCVDSGGQNGKGLGSAENTSSSSQDPETQILQECILSLEELQAMVPLPVVGSIPESQFNKISSPLFVKFNETLSPRGKG